MYSALNAFRSRELANGKYATMIMGHVHTVMIVEISLCATPPPQKKKKNPEGKQSSRLTGSSYGCSSLNE